MTTHFRQMFLSGVLTSNYTNKLIQGDKIFQPSDHQMCVCVFYGCTLADKEHEYFFTTDFITIFICN